MKTIRHLFELNHKRINQKQNKTKQNKTKKTAGEINLFGHEEESSGVEIFAHYQYENHDVDFCSWCGNFCRVQLELLVF